MTVAIVGGTGTLGRQVTQELRARGHEVRVLSRSSPQYRVDLTSGAGLDEAVSGCDTVVDASNNSSRTAAATLVAGTRRLLAAGERAGVAHHLCVSVVGCERLPMRYFRVKAEQEGAVMEGPLSWTIIRATQFHEYLAAMLSAGARYGLVPVPQGCLVQPVASAEVARVVAAAVEGGPRQGRVEVAGPEVSGFRELAVTWRRAAAKKAVLLPLFLPGALGRALRDGAATAAQPDVRGQLTFGSWVERNGTLPPGEGCRLGVNVHAIAEVEAHRLQD